MGNLVLFALAFLASAAPPGPDTMTVFSRGIKGGVGTALPFASGVLLAKLSLLGLALFGVAEVAQRFESAFVVVKVAGAAYLIVIGVRALLSRQAIHEEEIPDRPSGQDVLVGLGLGISNPNAVVFYVALVPNVVDLEAVTLGTYVLLGICLTACWAAIALAYAGLANKLRAAMKSATARGRLRRASGATMIGAGLLVATR